ncbi:MAG: efflux RND transporter periplasmic adaptor subunit [Salaquimonas sp.]|nr:efflux RND transporter periplasmic adaptor subunit [Salaquimonas sp.]
MKRRIIILLIVLIAAGGGYAGWRYLENNGTGNELVLFGNVDLRQVELAFNDSGRITEVLVEEGDQVKKGQALARLDTSRLRPQVANAEAQVAAQKAVVDKLHNGSRPEEVAQARANLEAAKADASNARQQYDRKSSLAGNSFVSQQALDTAKAAMEVAKAKVDVTQKALDLVVAGPRIEEIAQAEAQLRASQAQLALLHQQLDDATLVAPVDSVVRSRLMEPGEIATSQQPVFSLSIVHPKWVRAYISEPDLVRIRPGQPADVMVDGLPDTRIAGRIGFISPVAEFTPKAVQTQELRTSLVYEVRVNVDDTEDRLRLGMPASVYPKFDADGSPVASAEPEQRK